MERGRDTDREENLSERERERERERRERAREKERILFGFPSYKDTNTLRSGPRPCDLI